MSKEPPKNSREKTKNLLLKLQDNICKGLENTDGKRNLLKNLGSEKKVEGEDQEF